MVEIGGAIPESTSVEAPLPVLEQQTPVSLHEIWQAFDRAARDPRIKGVMVKPRGVGVGWAKLEEIRNGMRKVRSAGKPVYAWLLGPGMREYYLATAAERIFVSPEDVLDIKGLRVEATYFKGGLDKLGVQMEIEHVGKYKDAGDMMSRTSMSPETREVMDSILDDSFARITREMGEGRKRSGADVKALLDEGPFLAPVAKDKGLVDELAFEKTAEERLQAATKLKGQSWLGVRAYTAAPDNTLKNPKKIAWLVAQGDILRSSGADMFGEDQVISPASIRRSTRQIAEDSDIAGVVVRVDSPGGDAIASDEILHELKELSRKKPVVFSMSDAAASGGYYIAMTGDPVLAYPGTYTGSIGVIYGKPNLKGLYDKLGLSKEILTRGRFADIDSTYRPLSPEGRQKLRESLEFIYAGFLKRVSEGRKRPTAELEPLAQGRVWLGGQAKERGLIDELGGVDQAIAALRVKAKLAPGASVQLVVYPPRRSFFEQLLGSREEFPGAADAAPAGRLVRALGPGMLPWLYGGTLRVMPYRLSVE
jgi:protease-4